MNGEIDAVEDWQELRHGVQLHCGWPVQETHTATQSQLLERPFLDLVCSMWVVIEYAR
jgi:hypothetical protein